MKHRAASLRQQSFLSILLCNNSQNGGKIIEWTNREKHQTGLTGDMSCDAVVLSATLCCHGRLAAESADAATSVGDLHSTVAVLTLE